MRQTKFILYFVLLVVMGSSCIKPYSPLIKSIDANKYVVSGQVTYGDSAQIVNVSTTSPIGDPQYLPVTGCIVRILDDNGNEFPMSDLDNGDYSTWIDPELIIPGASFRVEVIIPSGDRIISGFDYLSECPDVDSVYYIREDVEGNEPGEYTLGIQFYVDLDGDDSDSRYYRWQVIETFEHHAEYPVEWYYDGTVHHVDPPDYSRYICWTTNRIPEVFTLSTTILTENKYKMLPLQYVNNRSSRLMYGYSLLVKQYALSEAAFNYWDQLRINLSQQGGLYETQPLAIKGNMQNLTHPENEVLGFFSVVAMTEKRIFVSDVPDLPLDFYTYCSPSALRKGLAEITPRDYPGYLMGDEGGWLPVLLNEECVNCMAMGGTNIKPNFWPN